MNDYYSVRIGATPCTSDITDLAAAYLGDVGFESFEPDADGLTAYIPATVGHPDILASEALKEFPMDVDFQISSSFVKGEDWNSEWEKNYFKPILIGGECVIHSSFHKGVPEAKYDIVIDPKMAFGTGHHDTTTGMVTFLLSLPLEGKRVIDVGTGTGILAILSSLRGASDVTGIEIDPAAYENAIENASLNNTPIRLILGDASSLASIPPADILLANINRNIILNDIEAYSSRLLPGGTMLLSGFYEQDADMILDAASKYGLSEAERIVSEAGWTALRLVKAED